MLRPKPSPICSRDFNSVGKRSRRSKPGAKRQRLHVTPRGPDLEHKTYSCGHHARTFYLAIFTRQREKPAGTLKQNLILILTLLSALGCGVIAGVFFAFSVFVMKALARLPPAQGIAAMQSINVAVLNRWFFSAFFGTAGGCAVLIGISLWMWHEAGAIHRLIGGALYLAGTILVTILFNVPRNNALAAVDPASPKGASLWARYLSEWTTWNHVRTVAALAAAAFLSVAICRG